ncbi:MAG: type II CAAX prenyl endopeptidase Rce1 family protein [Agathobacter rectalis]
MRCARKALPFALANLMQAALFGLFHLNWIQGIYAFALGIVLGYVRTRWLYLLLYGASSAFQPLGHTFRIFPDPVIV